MLPSSPHFTRAAATVSGFPAPRRPTMDTIGSPANRDAKKVKVTMPRRTSGIVTRRRNMYLDMNFVKLFFTSTK